MVKNQEWPGLVPGRFIFEVLEMGWKFIPADDPRAKPVPVESK